MYFNKCFGAYQMADEARSKLQDAVQFKARPATVIYKKPFEPKNYDRPLPDITAVVLNTERRANKREECDEMITSKHAEVENLRRLVCINNLKQADGIMISKMRMCCVCYMCSEG